MEETMSAEYLKKRISGEHFGFELEMVLDRYVLATEMFEALEGGQIDLVSEGESEKRKINIVSSKTGQIWGIDVDNTICNGEFDDLNLASELVTPKLHYSQVGELEAAIDAIGKTEAFLNEACAIHVHTDASNMITNAKGFDNPNNRIMANTYLLQDVLYDTLEVKSSRMADKIKTYTVEGMLGAEDVLGAENVWHNASTIVTPSKAHAVNLDTFYDREVGKKTIEFRMFNASLDSKVARAYIDLAIAIKVASEENAKIPPVKQLGMSHKESLNYLLESIGLFGDEYATTRGIITAAASEKKVRKAEWLEYKSEYDALSHGREITRNMGLDKNLMI
jgi:hypothetical protein